MNEFTIEKTITHDGEQQTAIESYSYTFENGVFIVFVANENGEYIPQCSQPWNPKEDGSREPWTNEQEAIDWFKSTRVE